MSRRRLFGVIGHVDHGKTALMRALTGMETDRLAEEKRRGISITLGFAHLRLDEDEIDFIDMPGHERFVRTMVSGATGIDAVLLVVAANEGIKPQTVEHVDIVALLGLRQAVFAVTKCDLVAPKAAARAAEAGQDLLRRAGVDLMAPPAFVSNVTGEGLPALREALRAAFASTQETSPPHGPAFLPVDRAFTLPGHGVVVTGSLRRGPMEPGQDVEILPSGRHARIRGLQVHGAPANMALPGQRVAVNLRAATLDDLPRGAALVSPGSLPSAAWLTVALRAVESAPPLETTERLRLLVGTDELEARLRLLDRDQLRPGETAFAQLHCARPVSLPAREHFILRHASPPRTVAGGRILDPEARRQRRHDETLLRQLAALDVAEGNAILVEVLAQARLQGIAVARAARLAAMEETAARDALVKAGAMVIAGATHLVDRPAWQEALNLLDQRLRSTLADAGAPLSPRDIARLVPEMGDRVLAAALADRIAAGHLRRRGSQITLAAPEAEAAARQSEQALTARLLRAARQGGLSPPDLLTDPDADVRRVLGALIRGGALIRTHDPGQKRDILFHAEAVRQAQQRLRAALPAGGMLVRDIGTLLGISRKFTIPLLEYLDSIHFTQRIGDRRVLGSKSGG